jgi:microcystin-dependent protein
MPEPFLGEIRMVSFNYAPRGWALCNGQLLPINTNQALFSLLGTNYGGNGQTTFGLPDLRGRIPFHVGGTDVGVHPGVVYGTESETVTQTQMPAHGHLRATSNQATSGTPVGNVLANAARRGIAAFAPPGPTAVMPGFQPVGGNQPHSNLQPYLTLTFVIATTGIFPSQH